MIALAVFSIGYAEDRSAAIKEALKWLELLIALVIVVDLAREPRAARWVIGAMLVAGAAEAKLDALVRQAAVRADRIGTGQPGTGQEESGNHPLNDLQESVLAAAHQLRADGHPPNTP